MYICVSNYKLKYRGYYYKKFYVNYSFVFFFKGDFIITFKCYKCTSCMGNFIINHV